KRSLYRPAPPLLTHMSEEAEKPTRVFLRLRLLSRASHTGQACSSLNIRNLIMPFEAYKNTVCHRNIPFNPLNKNKKGAIIQRPERNPNGSAKYGTVLAVFPCRAKSNLSLLEVLTGKG